MKPIRKSIALAVLAISFGCFLGAVTKFALGYELSSVATGDSVQATAKQ
jgi:hypothetical protein